jgi:DNA replication and repair protein RecF
VRLESLSLRQFRNYSEQTVQFGDADVQLFVGRNGSGKTNLLEAVSVLSITRSCRGRDDEEMVRWDDAFYQLKATVRNDAGDRSVLEGVCEVRPRRKKAFFINDVKTPLTGIVGFLPTVTFLPEDLELFTGPPAERRRFLDQLLSQLSPEYLVALSQYQKLVQQRNALLKRIASGIDGESSLDLWDRECAARAAVITVARLELMETLNLSFGKEFASLGEAWEDASLRYERKGETRNQADLEAEYRRLLYGMRDRDILLQSTGVGPHREDWQVWRGERPLPSFASRGQGRTAVLALLQLQVSYLELRRGEKPVILLDDAFSELDDHHQSSLLRSLQGHQVLMTTTRIPPEAERADVFTVDAGSVRRSEAGALQGAVNR